MAALVLVALAGWITVALLLRQGGTESMRIDRATAAAFEAKDSTIDALRLSIDAQAARIHQLDAMLDAYRAEGLKNPSVLEPAAPALPDALERLTAEQSAFLDGYEPDAREEAEAYLRSRIAGGTSIAVALAELERA